VYLSSLVQITIGSASTAVPIQLSIGMVTDKIRFFQSQVPVAGVGPQVSGGTLAGVIAGLVALGLFSS